MGQIKEVFISIATQNNNLVWINMIAATIAVILILDFRVTDIKVAWEEFINFCLRMLSRMSKQKRTMRELITGEVKEKTWVRLARTLLSRGTEYAKKMLSFLILFVLLTIAARRALLAIPVVYAVWAAPQLISDWMEKRKEMKKINDLRSFMTLVSSSYSRGNTSVVGAFEENVKNMEDEDMQRAVEVFVMSNHSVDHNLKNNLEYLKVEINHFIFSEWCDALYQCSLDSTKSNILHPIVNKLSAIISAEIHMEAKLAAERKDLLLMVCYYAFAVILFQFFSPEWFGILFGTVQGNAMFAVLTTGVLICVKKSLLTINSTDYRSALKGGE